MVCRTPAVQPEEEGQFFRDKDADDVERYANMEMVRVHDMSRKVRKGGQKEDLKVSLQTSTFAFIPCRLDWMMMKWEKGGQ